MHSFFLNSKSKNSPLCLKWSHTKNKTKQNKQVLCKSVTIASDLAEVNFKALKPSKITFSDHKRTCPSLISIKNGISVENQMEKTWEPKKSTLPSGKTNRQIEILKTCILMFRKVIGMVLGLKLYVRTRWF